MFSSIRNSKWLLALPLLLLLSLTQSSMSLAADTEVADSSDLALAKERIQRSADATLKFNDAADGAMIPTFLLKKVECVITMKTYKAGFSIGGQLGNGIGACRTPDGDWSAPIFLRMGGMSYGAQIGVAETDLMLVFSRKEAFQRVVDAHLKLGGELGVAVGPLGRHAEVATDVSIMEMEIQEDFIFSYARNRGAFIGAAFDGAIIFQSGSLNAAAYPGMTVDQILNTPSKKLPNKTLRSYADALKKFEE